MKGLMNSKYIEKLIKGDVESLDCTIWGIELSGRSKNPTIRVFIDKDKGISIKDCEKVSRHISRILEIDDHIEDSFSLEVSSPGIERKFFKKNQYSDYLGHLIKVRYRTKENQFVTEKGILEGVSKEGLTLKSQSRGFRLDFDSIEKAKLLFTGEC